MARGSYTRNYGGGLRGPSQVPVVPMGPWRSLLLSTGIFILALFLAGICIGLIKGFFPAGSRQAMIAASVVQNLVAFGGSALMISIILSRRPLRYLALDSRIRSITLFNILICFILGLPFLNEVIYYNSQLQFPDWMSAVGEWARASEDAAAKATSVMLSSTSVGGLIVTVLVVGVFTGFCEELFFRGALQRIFLTNGVNRHLAVWLAAFIFSLMHFQFFGFVPRLLLGAFFGYLLLWTGSVWTAAIAHALNNTIAIVSQWIANRGGAVQDVETIGVETSGFPWIAAISLVLLLTFIYIQRRRGF